MATASGRTFGSRVMRVMNRGTAYSSIWRSRVAAMTSPGRASTGQWVMQSLHW